MGKGERTKKKNTTVTANDLLGGEKKGKKQTSAKTSATKDAMAMSGEKGGNKTINMTITMNNNFSVAKGIGNIQNVANQIAGAMNDRLRDGLVAID